MSDDDYGLECADGRTVLSGVMRLASPNSYEGVFEPVKKGIADAAAVYTLDITRLKFMNSSGITALSRLVLHARTHNKQLVVMGTETVAWQKKTLTSLQRLYSRVDVRLS